MSARSTHAIERTSPKGGKFIGTCMKCGKPGLTFADMDEPCENIAGMSEDEALLLTIQGPEKKEAEPVAWRWKRKATDPNWTVTEHVSGLDCGAFEVVEELFTSLSAVRAEPVAWRWCWAGGDEPDVWSYQETEPKHAHIAVVEPLYASPAVRGEAGLEGWQPMVAKIVEAWEALPGGRQQSVRAVERWLAADMAKVINEARTMLAASPPDPAIMPVGASTYAELCREANAPAVEWVKQQYGATVATILETPDGSLEIQKLNSGKFNIIVHQRRGESDSFDDCSIQVKAEHLAAIGALVSEPPVGVTEEMVEASAEVIYEQFRNSYWDHWGDLREPSSKEQYHKAARAALEAALAPLAPAPVGVTEEQIAAGAQLVDPSGIFNLTWQECLERSQAVLEAALAKSARTK